MSATLHPELPEDIGRQRELAWIGDAVLALYARRWILRHRGSVSSETFELLTSNSFLSAVGSPTKIEATIGLIHEEDGYGAAADYIEAVLMPVFAKQERNRSRRPGRARGG